MALSSAVPLRNQVRILPLRHIPIFSDFLAHISLETDRPFDKAYTLLNHGLARSVLQSCFYQCDVGVVTLAEIRLGYKAAVWVAILFSREAYLFVLDNLSSV